MNREDFPILKNDIIYFDNGATTLKPKCVIDKITVIMKIIVLMLIEVIMIYHLKLIWNMKNLVI